MFKSPMRDRKFLNHSQAFHLFLVLSTTIRSVIVFRLVRKISLTKVKYENFILPKPRRLFYGRTLYLAKPGATLRKTRTY